MNDDKCKEFKVDRRRLKKLVRLLKEADALAGDLNLMVFIGSGTIYFNDDELMNTQYGVINPENAVADPRLTHFDGGDY